MPPNILLLVADDLPRNILGAYGATHGLTPELDKVAQHGITFTDAYTVAPLCTPSRYALLTGSYASRGARDRVSGEPALSSGERTAVPVSARQVDFQVFLAHHSRTLPTPTIGRTLREAGYLTGLLGKYHVGHSLQPSDCGAIGLNATRTDAAQPFVRASLLADSHERAVLSCRTIGNQTCLSASIRRIAGFDHVADIYYDNDALTFYAHQPEWMAHEALRFMRATKRHKKPFFLWMAPSLTHSPSDIARLLQAEPRAAPAGCGDDGNGPEADAFRATARRLRSNLVSRLTKAGLLCRRNATDLRVCPDEKLPTPSKLLHPEPWIPKEWFLGEGTVSAGRRVGLATSVGLAAWLDASLAPVFAEIAKEQGLIIFTADHGPYFAGKGHAYEAGVRVPFIASWTNAPLSAGARVSTRITHLDVFPTLSKLAGAASPSLAANMADGALIDVLLDRAGNHGGQGSRIAARPIFIEVGFSRSVVVDGYKLMLHLLPATAAGDSSCRSIHALKLPSTNESLAKGTKIKFLYDVRERHPVHHCDRVQLYDLASDPSEQRNVASLQPERVRSMRALIVAHVSRVEIPAVASATKQHRPPSPNATTTPGSSSAGATSRKLGTPRSWCQTCHPSAECDAWPSEWVHTAHEEPTSNGLGASTRAAIEQYAEKLVADMRGNASLHGVAQMVQMTRGEPYAPRDKCVLLRAVNGRLFIDFLGTDYGRQSDFSIASCFPSRKGNYLRSRFHVALRLILRALRRLGASLPPFEIGFCPDDCSPALKAGGHGVLPLLTSVSCTGQSTLPFVAWTVNSNRATDLSEWDSYMDEWARNARTAAWDTRIAKAVFRGHLRPFTVCGGWPSGTPHYNELVNASNWRGRGRSAIWAARIAHPELLDVNFDNHDEMAKLWKLSAAEANAIDEPTSISMEEQARRFRYAIHPEGQCGFADRLKSIMALPMLIFKQANPCSEWYEAMLLPGKHYLPVDGSYANLSDAIAWARAHDTEAQRIVAAANVHVRQVVSVAGVYAYSERLIRSYASRYAGHRAPGRSADEAVGTQYTHEFSCDIERGGHGTRCKIAERAPGPLPSSSFSL
jgi:arylsulfatase A-like enzyme